MNPNYCWDCLDIPVSVVEILDLRERFDANQENERKKWEQVRIGGKDKTGEIVDQTYQVIQRLWPLKVSF